MLSGQQTQYYEKWYHAEEGNLPQNSVKSIVKDKYGFVWLSTENGITRFDGKNFRNYNINLPGIENRTILIEGSSADDWLFTYYQSGVIPTLITKRENKVKAWQNDKDYQELIKYGHRNLHTILRDNGEQVQRLKKCFFITKKTFYYLENYQLFFQDGNKTKLIRKLDGYLYYRFFLLNNNLFYLKNSTTVEKISRNGELESHKIKATIDTKNFEYYINNANQQLLIKSNNSILNLQYNKGELTTSTVYNSNQLKNTSIYSLYYEPKYHMLFIGTIAKGLLIVRKNFINTHNNNSSDNIFNAIAPFDDNSIITAKGEIFGIDGYKSRLHFPDGQDNYGILSLKNKSEFLLQRNKRIFLISPYAYKEILNFNLISSGIYSFNKGYNDKIWLSIWDQGKCKLGYIIIKDGLIKEKKLLRSNFCAKSIFDIDKKNLLLATESGLLILDKSKNTTKILVPKINFRNINSNNDGLVWVQSYGKGLYLYKEGRIYGPPENNKNLLSSIHSVIADDNGYYWLSSNNGLFQIKKENLIDYYLKKIPNIYIHKYDKNDGLRTTEFNGGSNTNGLKINENIVFPSMDGIVFINTKSANPVLSSENYYIDKVSIDNKEINITNDIRLDRDFDNLRIFVDYANFGNLKNDCIEYKIDDKKWENLDESRILYINSLPSGDHKISFRKLKNFSSNYTYKKINLNVEPAFWETYLFKFLIILLVIIVSYVFYLIRARKIKKEKLILNKKIDQKTQQLKETVESLYATREELYAQLFRKKKFLAIITHDIKTPLKYIKLSSDFLLDDTISIEEKEKIVNSIQESISKIIAFIESTISYNKIFINSNFSNKEDINLHNFIEKRLTLFTNIAAFKNLELLNQVEKKKLLSTNPDVLSIVIHNIIDNAIKYTDTGYIQIYLMKTSDNMRLVFEDTGIGLSEDEINKITTFPNSVGMRIISELLPLIDCKMEIISRKNEGTKIILVFNH
ncbi:Sensor histidine kinase RcsC [Chryseobacterium aquaeductus]|uniref:histidine kinase n=2 Tax=Chryseobacterium aquaeductus TaxID=2675056 RepID=A0A9N8MPJ9_9FLAO|nr:Sensor histidine kinase RcsC [Chryseobacterium potabilaquae]CAD7811791.1 Sensor histidine kinase RcsC [Chryseobacterium aquaeductus]